SSHTAVVVAATVLRALRSHIWHTLVTLSCACLTPDMAVRAKALVLVKLMDTRQLHAFCEVVERRSFSLAAERLGVSQPAVSLQVRSLEKRLGTQLLDRSGRRVAPTETGLKLYRSAQRLL